MTWRATSAATCRSRRQPEHQFQSTLDILQKRPAHASHRFAQEIAVDGEYLRHVGDRVSRQSAGFGWNQDIARGLNETHVRRQHNDDRGAQAAAVEGVALNDQNRTTIARSRTARRFELGPPDLSTLDYHVSRPRDRRCARVNRVSRRLSSELYTALSWSVIFPPRCFAIKSESAVAYNRLRETSMRFRRVSAEANRSSGMESATFIPKSYHGMTMIGSMRR